MKSYMKGLFVILAIVMSFVAVQNVCAETYMVEGTIDEFLTKPNRVVVDETEVYGVRVEYLANQYTIDLQVGDNVRIKVYDYLCSDGTIKIKACEITVGDVTVSLRTCP